MKIDHIIFIHVDATGAFGEAVAIGPLGFAEVDFGEGVFAAGAG